MSEKSVRLSQRRRRYQLRLRGEKKGVSPVVATLILILIAVAAAAALYLWLVVWQGNITGGIGSPHAQSTLSIGGSTSVYPFSSTAASWFEQNQSDTVISDNQGGTGAGMLAVCAGSVDIGAASSLETASGLIASDGCPSADLNTIQITTIAYDAVDVIVPVANDHGLVSINSDTLTLVYADDSVLEGASPTAVLYNATENGLAVPTGVPTPSTVTSAAPLTWEEIPAVILGGTVTGAAVAQELSAGVGGTITTDYVTCGTSGHDLCAIAATDDTPCGFTICAGGTGAGTAAGEYSAPIATVARSDASGTTQTFEARVLGASSATKLVTGWSQLAFTGCGSNNLLSDCGYVAEKTGNGNPGVISAVAGDVDSIGYASDGLARASSSGVTCEGVSTAACGIALETPYQGAAVQPSLGATGTIAAGIVNGGFGTPGLTTTAAIDASYAGARPFEFVSLQPYTGVAEEFVQFILDPANNIALASATGEVSIYSI